MALGLLKHGVGGLQTHIMSCAGPPPAHSPGKGPSTPPALGPFSLDVGEARRARWRLKGGAQLRLLQ